MTTAVTTSVIEVAKLTHQFGDRMILDGIDLEIQCGEIYGLLGPNGAGKSTAIRAISGFLRPDSGSIRLFGNDMVRYPARSRDTIGVVSEDVGLFEAVSAHEFLCFIGHMHGLNGSEARNRTNSLLALLELEASSHEPIAGYSLGMKRKVSLAAALIHAPQVLLLDEPFNGIDAPTIRRLCELLHKLASERRITVVFTSHVTDYVRRLCNRTGILHNGRLYDEQELMLEMGVPGGAEPALELLLERLSGAAPTISTITSWYQ